MVEDVRGSEPYTVERETKEDGRYVIYFTFPDDSPDRLPDEPSETVAPTEDAERG